MRRGWCRRNDPSRGSPAPAHRSPSRSHGTPHEHGKPQRQVAEYTPPLVFSSSRLLVLSSSRPLVLSSSRLLKFTALAIILLAPFPALAQPPAQGITVERLRPTLHVAAGYANGNVLILEADSGLLLVDAQSAERVAALDSAIRRISRRPVRLVINTHYHGDHTEGNAHFRRAGAQVLAQRALRPQAARDTVIAEWDNWHRTPLPEWAMPTREFGDSLHFTFGTEPVVVLHAPHAHTDGDAMVWLPRLNVLHIGDILEVGAPPFIDLWAGGSLAGMLAAIDRVLAMTNDSTTIVPGHGAVATPAGLRRYRAMLATVGARVSAAVARGESIDTVLAATPAREWDAALGGPRRASHLVRLVYADAVRARRPGGRR